MFLPSSFVFSLSHFCLVILISKWVPLILIRESLTQSPVNSLFFYLFSLFSWNCNTSSCFFIIKSKTKPLVFLLAILWIGSPSRFVFRCQYIIFFILVPLSSCSSLFLLCCQFSLFNKIFSSVHPSFHCLLHHCSFCTLFI